MLTFLQFFLQVAFVLLNLPLFVAQFVPFLQRYKVQTVRPCAALIAGNSSHVRHVYILIVSTMALRTGVMLTKVSLPTVTTLVCCLVVTLNHDALTHLTVFSKYGFHICQIDYTTDIFFSIF